jgi:hypothetical protein
MTAGMRAALYPSGARMIRWDADLLLDLLLEHRDKVRRLQPDAEASRRVQNLVEELPGVGGQSTAQSVWNKKLLPATTQSRQRTPRSGASCGAPMDSHPVFVVGKTASYDEVKYLAALARFLPGYSRYRGKALRTFCGYAVERWWR